MGERKVNARHAPFHKVVVNFSVCNSLSHTQVHQVKKGYRKRKEWVCLQRSGIKQNPLHVNKDLSFVSLFGFNISQQEQLGSYIAVCSLMQDYGPFETLSDSLHLTDISIELDICGLKDQNSNWKTKGKIV